MLRLIIHEPGKRPRYIVLERPEYTLGRSKENDIIFDDSAMSRSHALIFIQGDFSFIQDRNSSGGTYLNRRRIYQKTVIRDGDILVMGETRIEVETEGKTAEEWERTRIADPELQKKLMRTRAWTNWAKIAAFEPETDATSAEGKKRDQHHRLIIVSEEDFGREYPLNHSEIQIGRSSGASVRLSDNKVSTYHALLEIRGDDCYLKDMNSKNGTLVEGVFILDRRLLEDEDRIRIGNTKLLFVHKHSTKSKQAILKPFKTKHLAKNRRWLWPFAVFFVGFLLLLWFKASLFGYSEFQPAISVTKPAVRQSPNPNSPIARKAQPDETAEQQLERALSDYVKGEINEALNKLNRILTPDLRLSHRLKNGAHTLKKNIQIAQALFEQGVEAYQTGAVQQSFTIWEKLLLVDQEISGSVQSHYSKQVAWRIADEFSKRAWKDYQNQDYDSARKNCELALKAVPGFESAIRLQAMLPEKNG